MIGDCGHAVAAEQPARAWTAISAFLDESRVVSASREIAAGLEQIFELIADPAQQPRWDGNDNLAEAAAGQRVRAVGDVFIMTLTGRSGPGEPRGRVRGRPPHRLAPVRGGPQPAGHLWRWELVPLGDSRTRVTHTYDWTRLTDSTGCRAPGGPRRSG